MITRHNVFERTLNLERATDGQKMIHAVSRLHRQQHSRLLGHLLGQLPSKGSCPASKRQSQLESKSER